MARYRPYGSTYNPIEHRLFPHLTLAFQAVVFHTVKVVNELMETTKTRTGLEVTVHILDKTYEMDRKGATGFKENRKIVVDRFLSQGNYRAVSTVGYIGK